MPRKKIYRIEQYPYHLTARCTNKEWFALPLGDVWNIFAIHLYFVTVAFKIQIHSFVLMSNHFHMLATAPEANIDEAMVYLLREVNRRMVDRTEQGDQIFDGAYRCTQIKNSVHYQHAYKYVYRNPVHAGICNKVEDYSYSTLRRLIGLEYLSIPVIDNQRLIADTGRVLKWLNLEYSTEDRELIRSALQHREFQFPKEELGGCQSTLESRVV